MAFGLTPHDFLSALEQDLAEFRADRLSLRKAIHCVVLSNHLPEHVWHAHDVSRASSDNALGNLKQYRLSIEAREPDLRIIRDLCNAAKHVTLRQSATVASVKSKDLPDAFELVAAATGIPTGRNPGIFGVGEAIALFREDALVIEMADGTERRLDKVLERTFAFWQQEVSNVGPSSG